MYMRRNIYKLNKYKNKISSIFCANPKCKTPNEGIEIHHIIPIKYGGEDTEDNMIQLCHKCHRTLGLHHEWESHYDELLSWKIATDTHYKYVLDKICIHKHTDDLIPARLVTVEKVIWEEVPSEDITFKILSSYENGTHTMRYKAKS